MRKLSAIICALFMSIALSAYADGCPTLLATDFGAKADGQHIDSHAINKALEAAAQRGGGTVRLTAGTYLCHSIRLQSNCTLLIDEDATIRAARNGEQGEYDAAEKADSILYQDFGHSHWKNSLIWGIGLRNVRIAGKGLIDGTDALSSGHRRNLPATEANKAISLKECVNVSIEGLTMLRCGHFAMLLTGVDSLTIDGVTADTNRDGFDIDCCEHVTVRNCTVNTLNDDAIVLKCSYALGRMKPTANVLIENCRVSGYDIGTLIDGTLQTKTEYAIDRDGPTGRVKLGTESNSRFSNITIRNIEFRHCRGLALETVDGALLENVTVEDITMDDICNSPIYLRVGNRMRAPEGTPPSKMRNISIRRLRATNCDSRYAILMVGLKGNSIENVTLEDIDIEFRGGLTYEDVTQQRGANEFFTKRMKGYPEPSAHGIQTAWGMSLSFVSGIVCKNVNLHLMKPDARPMIRTYDVQGDITGVTNTTIDETNTKIMTVDRPKKKN